MYKIEHGHSHSISLSHSFSNLPPPPPLSLSHTYILSTVPPDIIDYQTSHDVAVDEGSNITLRCTALGLPEPTIEWRREEKKPVLSIGNNDGM